MMSMSGNYQKMPTYKITIKMKVTPTRRSKRIAIIGSGPGGIAAAKYAAAAGITPVIFDCKDKPCGLWASGSAIWEGMHTNVSRYSVMFSDYPWPDSSNLIPSAKDVYDYLISYIKHFGLENYFRLNTFVESVKYLPNKCWQVTSVNNITKERTSETFDFCICATGCHSKPIIPKIENADKFQGVVLHSSNYRSNDDRLRGKKVVVVGNSYSGVEIAAHLVGHARTVVNIFSRPYLVLPRLVKLESRDNRSERNFMHILPMDMISGRDKLYTKLSKEEQRAAKIQLFSKICPHQTNKKLAHPAMYYDLDTDEPVRKAVTDNYYPFVRQGKIIPRRTRIKRFERDGVVYEDGTFEKVDAIIYCTGYRLNLDYLDESVKRTLKYDPNNEAKAVSLYKYTLHPELENMAFIGKFNGLFYAGFELQAKWAIKIFSGERFLPPKEIMLEEMRKFEIEASKKKDTQFPYGTYLEMIDKLAVESDSLPDFAAISRNDPKLFDMLWRNGVFPSHFALNSNRDVAMKVLREVDEMTNRKYYFDEHELIDCPTSVLAAKFSRFYRMPMHLFKD